MKRDKEGHYIMIKGSIQEEDITIVNIYAPNIGALQYARQILKKINGKSNSNTTVVGDFNEITRSFLLGRKAMINLDSSPWGSIE